MRLLDTFNLGVDTSVGRISGELWSDGLLGIASPIRDVEVEGFRDVAALRDALTEVGVPDDEATAVADAVWADGLGKFVERHLYRG